MKKKFIVLLVTLLLIVSISLFFIKIINNKITPLVMDYSIGQMKKITSIIINRSINSDILDQDDMNKLFVITRNSSDEVLTISLDSIIVNKITDNISDACEDNLRLIEEGKYELLRNKFNVGEEYFYVPSGIVFKNTLFNSFGPRIPINLKIIGNVTSGIKTEVKEYGINNSLITISSEITVEMMVILPFSSDYVSITNSVPISIKLIQGKVPNVYGGYLSN